MEVQYGSKGSNNLCWYSSNLTNGSIPSMLFGLPHVLEILLSTKASIEGGPHREYSIKEWVPKVINIMFLHIES